MTDDHTPAPAPPTSPETSSAGPDDPDVTQHLALEREKLRFERQKYALELRLKRRELKGKGGKSVWQDVLTNPVTIAVVGGVITLMTGIVTNYLNSTEARRADAARAALAEISAKETLQADLIKKFVENPSTDAVRENLRFLADAGLIPAYQDGIKHYLDSHPGVAPQVGGGIQFLSAGVSVANETRQRLQSTALRFIAYLRGLGFPGLEQNVSVFIYSKDRPPPRPSTVVNAYYDKGTIYIHEAMVGDVSVALREYTHHALFVALGSPSDYSQNEIESALSDYLPASFLGSPIIGEGLGSLFGLPTSYIRTLDTRAPYGSASPVDVVGNGAVWAASLWACRGRVNQQAVDGTALPTWRQAMSAPVDDAHVAERFRKALTTTAPPTGPCFSAELAARNIP